MGRRLGVGRLGENEKIKKHKLSVKKKAKQGKEIEWMKAAIFVYNNIVIDRHN